MEANVSIIALHGFLGHFSQWDPYRKNFEISAVDLWSYSAEPQNCPTDLVDALQREYLVNPSKIIMGYSMGGRIALEWCLRYPTRFEAAILVSTQPGLLHGSDKIQRAQSDDVWAERLLDLSETDFFKLWNSQPVFAKDSEIQSNFPTNQLRLAFALRNWSVANQAHDLDSYETPTLWITGGNDSKYVQIIENIRPRGLIQKKTVISGAGHRVPWSHVLECEIQIKTFLKEIGKCGSP